MIKYRKQQIRKRGLFLRKLTVYLKNYKKEMILGPIFKLTEAVFELIVPLVMARIIDVGIANKDSAYILKMGGLLFVLGICGLACALTCQYFATRCSQGFGTELRNAFFKHINAFSHQELDALGTASLITRITSDINQAQLSVAMMIRLVIRSPFLVVGAIVMATTISLRLSVFFLLAALGTAVVLYVILHTTVPLYRKIQQRLDHVGRLTREQLSGARVIRAFSRQEDEQARLAKASGLLKASSEKAGRISALLNPLTYVIINGTVLLVLWFGGIQVNAGTLSQGQVIALVNYLSQILLALIALANLIVILSKGYASANRIAEVLSIEPGIVDPPHPQSASPQSGQPIVEFSHVSFAYPGADTPCLSDCSVRIMPGSTVGLIGGTGAGKSSFVNLLLRFYDVQKGHVLVDGVDVQNQRLSSLRAKIGLVPQRAVLFSGTLRSNLQWGNPDASDEQIWQALETAQAAEFVRALPDGLDTMIAQGGQNLSGGQRQRLTIARALVRRPEILILDDSASALDFATDAKLRHALARVNSTVLMVSQRASTLRHCHNILVFEEGRIVDQGPHETLYQRCGVYREIVDSQTMDRGAAK